MQHVSMEDILPLDCDADCGVPVAEEQVTALDAVVMGYECDGCGAIHPQAVHLSCLPDELAESIGKELKVMVEHIDRQQKAANN